MISKLYEQRLRGDLFKLSILTLITVVFWVGIATYRVLSKSQVKPKVLKQIIPLTPIIDLDTMRSIEQRRQAPLTAWGSIKLELPEVVVVPEVSGASPSAELESTEATESAE